MSVVTVSGEEISLLQLVAIAESLEAERPFLFGCLKSFHSTPEEMKIFCRAMIREDYQNFADEYCKICMDAEASIHGSITLECYHRFCEGCYCRCA